MGGERESRESRVCVHRVCVRVVAVVVALHAPGRRGENFSLHLRFFLAFFFFFAYVLFLLLDVCVSPLGKEDGKHP